MLEQQLSALGLLALSVCDAVEVTLDDLPLILKVLSGLFLSLVIGSAISLFLDFLQQFLSVFSRRINHLCDVKLLSLLEQGDAAAFLWFLGIEVLFDGQGLVVVFDVWVFASKPADH